MAFAAVQARSLLRASMSCSGRPSQYGGSDLAVLPAAGDRQPQVMLRAGLGCGSIAGEWPPGEDEIGRAVVAQAENGLNFERSRALARTFERDTVAALVDRQHGPARLPVARLPHDPERQLFFTLNGIAAGRDAPLLVGGGT